MNFFPAIYLMSVAFTMFHNTNPSAANELLLQNKLFLRAIINGHSQKISAHAVSPDKSFIVVSSWDGTSTVWNSNTGQLKYLLREKEKAGNVHFITSVAINEDNKILTGSSDTCASLWDGATGEKIQTLKGHKDFVVSVALSNGKDMTNGFMVTGAHDGHAIIWDMGGNVKHTLIHQEPILKILVSKDDLFVVIVTQSTVYVWDVATGSKKYSLPEITDNSTIPVVLSSKYIVLGRLDGKVLMFDISSGGLEKVLYEHSKKIKGLAITPNDQFVLASSDDMFTISEIKTCILKHTCSKPGQSAAKSFIISDDSKHVLVETEVDASLWDIASGQCVDIAPNSLSTEPATHDQEFLGSILRGKSVFVYTRNRETQNISTENKIEANSKTKNPRIAIIGVHDENYDSIGKYAHLNKQSYAKRHGYDVFLYKERLAPDRLAYWDKIVALQKHLEDYDWLFWLDSDALVMNQSIKLEDIIDENYCCIMTKACSGSLLSGQFLIKNCAWSKEFLKNWYAIEHTHTPPGMDNGALIDLYRSSATVREQIKIIPQRMLGSFIDICLDIHNFDGAYQTGDFGIHFPGLVFSKKEQLMRQYFLTSQEINE